MSKHDDVIEGGNTLCAVNPSSYSFSLAKLFILFLSSQTTVSQAAGRERKKLAWPSVVVLHYTYLPTYPQQLTFIYCNLNFLYIIGFLCVGSGSDETAWLHKQLETFSHTHNFFFHSVSKELTEPSKHGYWWTGQ